MKQLNEAVFQEKERLHITLDSIGEAVVCIDMAMKITFARSSERKMSGWTQERSVGVPLWQLFMQPLTKRIIQWYLQLPKPHGFTVEPVLLFIRLTGK
ncbi:hypothetical protein DJICPGNB_08940 [Escherichia coli]|nr:hypothetical protein DJICPGNB_08940 [Escherichia coli]